MNRCLADFEMIGQAVGTYVLLLLERPDNAVSELDARCSWGGHGLYTLEVAGTGGNGPKARGLVSACKGSLFIPDTASNN